VSMLKKVKSARRRVAGDDTSKGWRSGKGSLGVPRRMLEFQPGQPKVLVLFQGRRSW
jgi:hypothetical protein